MPRPPPDGIPQCARPFCRGQLRPDSDGELHCLLCSRSPRPPPPALPLVHNEKRWQSSAGQPRRRRR